MEVISESRCFGGVQGVYSHDSDATGTQMTFGLFLPEEAEHAPVPVLWFLAGLTCTHENAMVKAGAQVWAAEHGIAIAYPDTSPRGEGVANDDAYDMGQGAGFYVNATEKPWAPHFRMFDYVTQELPKVISNNFAVDEERQSITGHSMGGHGALTLAMNVPHYRSVSAFSPICNPTAGDWGRPQFTNYLGADESKWAKHDATLLMQNVGLDIPLLVDTGANDQYADFLMTEKFWAATAERRIAANLRLQKGYDHSYFFVSSFLEDHIAFHAEALYA